MGIAWRRLMSSFAWWIRCARRISSSSSCSRSWRLRAARSSRSRSARRSNEVCEEEGVSQPWRARWDCLGGERVRRWSSTYARSSTMMGRPLGSGDEGAEKVDAKSWGGVVGVGGASTMMMRSFLCWRVGFRDDRLALE